MKFNIEKIQEVAKKLDAMPRLEKAPKELSKQETVKALSKNIESLQKRGYGLEQIGDILRAEGIEVANTTLKSYLLKAKPATKKTEKAADTGSSAAAEGSKE